MPSGKAIDYDAAMQLPAGRTCADCRHCERCVGLGYSNAANTSCDFYPNKFLPKPVGAR
jgi:hypothetical protein